MNHDHPLLETESLSVSFGGHPVVDGVDLTVGAGEIVSIVGESGSGKSVTALAVLGLLGSDARVDRGSIRFEGEELLGLPEARLRRLRGREISMIFQEPMSSLNPVYPIGFQVDEVFVEHFGMSWSEARRKTVGLLDRVGIPLPADRAGSYPHELSGGMRQRVMIAMAMALTPKLLLADEPTTALDVTIQAQILRLIRELSTENGTSVLLITHDMGVVVEMATRVLVMYAGQIVEEGSVEAIFTTPRHPYTKALLECAPRVRARVDDKRLRAIPGQAPSSDYPNGCRFHPRCAEAVERCTAERPALVSGARCLLVQEAEQE